LLFQRAACWDFWNIKTLGVRKAVLPFLARLEEYFFINQAFIYKSADKGR